MSETTHMAVAAAIIRGPPIDYDYMSKGWVPQPTHPVADIDRRATWIPSYQELGAGRGYKEELRAATNQAGASRRRPGWAVLPVLAIVSNLWHGGVRRGACGLVVARRASRRQTPDTHTRHRSPMGVANGVRGVGGYVRVRYRYL